MLKIKGFLPFVIMVFLNAFVDLGHKIMIQNTVFKVYDGETQIVLTAIVNGLILLPFILLFSPAGFISDRFEKHKVMRVSAWVAVVVTLLITLFYYLGWFWAAFAMTFALAVQSAFYSPAKYGYIKELVGKQRLSQGNAVVQATTTVSILLGILGFSFLFEGRLTDNALLDKTLILQRIAPLGWVLVGVSVLELFSAYRLPKCAEANSQEAFDFGRYRRGEMTRQNILTVWQHRVIWLSIIGLSVFWMVSQSMLAVFPAHAKAVLGHDDTRVIQGILACTGLGIIVGSIIAGRISRNYIDTGLIPVGALGIALGIWLMPSLQEPIAMAAVFALIGIAGGLFIVPLNSLIQYHAGEGSLAKVLASNNLIQNIFMLTGLLVTSLFAAFNFTAQSLLWLLALMASVGAVYTIYRLPQSLMRFIVARALGRRYRIVVSGFDNIPESGGVLLLGNHVSLLDWAILGVASPRSINFVMHERIYSRWYLRWFLDLVGAIPIAPGASKAALARVHELLNNGEVVCLFPEGMLSRNGQMGEFKRGFERAAAGAKGVIVPFYLHGLWGSRFSSAGQPFKRKIGQSVTRNLIISFGPAMPMSSDAMTVKQHVFELSIDAWRVQAEQFTSLQGQLVEALQKRGRQPVMTDDLAKPRSGYASLAAARLLAKGLLKQTKGTRVGVILPAGSDCALLNIAILMAGKTVVNLNYSAGAKELLQDIAQAQVDCVISARQFFHKLDDEQASFTQALDGVDVRFVDEVKASRAKLPSILAYLACMVLPASWYARLFTEANDGDAIAAIAFTSGSAGARKAVALSHRNILTNTKQIAQVLDVQENDSIMVALPWFHAFGFTTALLPILEGIPVVFHADGKNVKHVARFIAHHRISVLIATPSTLDMYNQRDNIEPLLLQSLRVVVSGGDKLSPSTRARFKARFAKDIYEGYGATELSPVASVNLPDRLDSASMRVIKGSKEGSVGLPLPGTSFKIVDPENRAELPRGETGMVLIGGPQVMLGYDNAAALTAAALEVRDGIRWFVSDDMGYMDVNGFLTLVDRHSRVVAMEGGIAGLHDIERQLAEHLQLNEHAVVVVNLAQATQGAELALAVVGDVAEQELRQRLVDAPLDDALIPSRVQKLDKLPLLGSGKIDYVAVQRYFIEVSQ